jgi:phosphoribosylanthranilate isomerase
LNPPSTPCRVKVCGVRDAAEAAALDALGVDWIGFNFHPKSPRFITPEDAAPIIKSLKRSVPVGVFVDADAARVRAVAAERKRAEEQVARLLREWEDLSTALAAHE